MKQTRDIVLLGRQASICTAVLECMVNVARKKHLTPEIWEALLRVLLGICDSLLRLPNTDPSLENMLTSTLLKVRWRVFCAVWVVRIPYLPYVLFFFSSIVVLHISCSRCLRCGCGRKPHRRICGMSCIASVPTGRTALKSLTLSTLSAWH